MAAAQHSCQSTKAQRNSSVNLSKIYRFHSAKVLSYSVIAHAISTEQLTFRIDKNRPSLLFAKLKSAHCAQKALAHHAK